LLACVPPEVYNTITKEKAMKSFISGGSKSSGIIQIGSNGFIARNKIDGSGAIAMQALTFGGIKTNGNTFAWNDINPAFKYSKNC